MRWRHGQGRGPERGRSNELRKAKPEMFDAWIEGGQRTGDNALRWETAESVVSSKKISELLPLPHRVC